MDLKSELLPQIRPPEFLDKGRERFSPETFLRNLGFAVKNRKFMSTLFGALALWSTITNPLNTPNPEPYLRNLILGPKPVAEASNLQPNYEELIVEDSPSIEDQIFKNFSAEEKAVAEKEIADQVKIYKDTSGSIRAERVLDWEKSTLKPILELDVLEKDRKFWSNYLSAVVYVESGGIPNAESEVGIVGLAQISEATASATGKRHGIGRFDLTRGWDSLRLSRFHLQDLMERYNPDMSLLGYYGGQGLADKRIIATLVKRGASISSNEQLGWYVNHYRINVFNIGSPDGEEYFTKFVAALRILEQARATPQTIN